MSDLFIGLAVFAVAHTIVTQRGMFSMFNRLRLWAAGEELKANSELAYLLGCVWCLSFWLGLIAAILADRPIWYALVYNAISGVIQSYVDSTQAPM